MGTNLMTPDQALKLLIEATRLVQATRDQHQAIIEALEVIKKAIEEDKSE